MRVGACVSECVKVRVCVCGVCICVCACVLVFVCFIIYFKISCSIHKKGQKCTGISHIYAHYF